LVVFMRFRFRFEEGYFSAQTFLQARVAVSRDYNAQ